MRLWSSSTTPSTARPTPQRDTGDALLAYTSDAGALLEKRAAIRAGDLDNTVVRQAGFEDVFLRLTGRSLIE